jgi:hypothetical protein
VEKMFQTNNRYTGCLFNLITIIVIFIFGCINVNDEIIVDLDYILEWVVQYPPEETDAINFGFNRWLSPKEKYAHVLTDRDSKEIPNGFTDSRDEDYAQLRELAARSNIIE